MNSSKALSHLKCALDPYPRLNHHPDKETKALSWGRAERRRAGSDHHLPSLDKGSLHRLPHPSRPHCRVMSPAQERGDQVPRPPALDEAVAGSWGPEGVRSPSTSEVCLKPQGLGQASHLCPLPKRAEAMKTGLQDLQGKRGVEATRMVCMAMHTPQ